MTTIITDETSAHYGSEVRIVDQTTHAYLLTDDPDIIVVHLVGDPPRLLRCFRNWQVGEL